MIKLMKFWVSFILIFAACVAELDENIRDDSGSCGAGESDDVRWYYEEISSTLYINGTGYMKDYSSSSSSSAPWSSYASEIKFVVVAEEVKAGDLEKLIASEAGGLLEGVKLFDVYRGVPVPPMCKSLAFSLTYRAKDRTLTDAEVNAINERVLAALKNGFNAVLREI